MKFNIFQIKTCFVSSFDHEEFRTVSTLRELYGALSNMITLLSSGSGRLPTTTSSPRCNQFLSDIPVFLDWNNRSPPSKNPVSLSIWLMSQSFLPVGTSFPVARPAINAAFELFIVSPFHTWLLVWHAFTRFVPVIHFTSVLT